MAKMIPLKIYKVAQNDTKCTFRFQMMLTFHGFLEKNVHGTHDFPIYAINTSDTCGIRMEMFNHSSKI